ncbi:MAG: dTDP-4-dehydrorhamnose reductase [Alphaproteobacteria bacterium]|nr:dTDP-4-dehydrorhamnose reductase [Alphaproteobacteria bacterium]
MSIVVIGKSGQVARALQRLARERGLPLVALGRQDFDLEHPSIEAIADMRPTVVINAGAYTEVDQAESAKERAFAINAVGAEIAARASAKVGAAFVHYSTDYVFGGVKREPYVETDDVGPTSVYGASKLEGEMRVREAAPNAVVLRTSWVFDAEGKNFVRTMLRLAKSHREIKVVGDQYGSPTYALDLADATLNLAGKLQRGDGEPGIYHCAGTGETSWAAFAREVFARSVALGGPSAEIVPISTDQYPTKAKRPQNSRLDCSKLSRDYNITMRPWTESVAACVGSIAAAGWRVE